MALGLYEDIILLKATAPYQDDEGGWHEGEREERTVSCQAVIYGAMTRAQIRDSDIRLQNTSTVAPHVAMTTMATVELWTIDYEGEDQALYRGEEVQVEVDVEYGEKTRLILRRQLGNETQQWHPTDGG